MADERKNTSQLEMKAQVAPLAAPEEQNTNKRKRSSSKSAAGLAPDTIAAKRPAPKSRRHSDEDKVEKLRRIDALLAEGNTLKSAVKAVGISDETYYIWKRAQQPEDTKPAPVVDDDLAEFIKLEEENRALRKQLGDKLRAENIELRRRLGLD